MKLFQNKQAGPNISLVKQKWQEAHFKLLTRSLCLYNNSIQQGLSLSLPCWCGAGMLSCGTQDPSPQGAQALVWGVRNSQIQSCSGHLYKSSQGSCCTGRGIGASRKTQLGGQLEPVLAKENKESKLRFFHSFCVEVSRKENRTPGWSCYPSLFHLSPHQISAFQLV